MSAFLHADLDGLLSASRNLSVLASHHYLLLVGHHRVDMQFLGKVFGLTVQEI